MKSSGITEKVEVREETKWMLTGEEAEREDI